MREKKVLSLDGKSGGMLDDESGESIEEEVPVVGTAEQVAWNLGDWYEVGQEKLGVGSIDEVKHNCVT